MSKKAIREDGQFSIKIEQGGAPLLFPSYCVKPFLIIMSKDPL